MPVLPCLEVFRAATQATRNRILAAMDLTILMVMIGLLAALIFVSPIILILVRVTLRPRRVTRQDLFDAAMAARPAYLASDGRWYSGDGRLWWDGTAWRPLQRP